MHQEWFERESEKRFVNRKKLLYIIMEYADGK